MVIDPKRHFGAPALDGAVPVDTVLDQLNAGDSPELVAEIFGLELEHVHDAMEWGNYVASAA